MKRERGRGGWERERKKERERERRKKGKEEGMSGRGGSSHFQLFFLFTLIYTCLLTIMCKECKDGFSIVPGLRRQQVPAICKQDPDQLPDSG